MALFDVIDATWPAAQMWRDGAFVLRNGQGGGKRVSAASLVETDFSDHDIDHAETAMQRMQQDPLFMIRSGDTALDETLGERGYDIIDPVNVYKIPAQELAQTRPPKVCMFSVWPPLAIQGDIWARAGIGPARLAVMDRAQGPKTTILARWNDKPAGTAYVACHDHTAMLHALEILPAHQRQGLGRIVMNHAAFWALDQGMSYVTTLCVDTNLPANGLYSSLGMKVVEHYHYRIKRT